ncbi:Hypothetical protein A7982_08436 [Minicystis rosea]|nr:Hypothetical protein A7982_08436 [Minicystis rosea]
MRLARLATRGRIRRALTASIHRPSVSRARSPSSRRGARLGLVALRASWPCRPRR